MQNNTSKPGSQPNTPPKVSSAKPQDGPPTAPLAGQSAKQSTSASPNGTAKTTPTASLRAIPPIRSDYHPKLALVDNGRIVEAVKSLRENCEKTSPNEIYLVLNPSQVAEAAAAQFSQKALVIEGWRNSLILLPIMVTWISLGLAGLAYTQSIVADPRLVAKPFLEQWAEGFTILTNVSVWMFRIPLIFGSWRYFSFGDVAFLDFTLFIILLFLTIRAQSIESQAAEDANDLGTWLREECDILRAHTYARIIGQGHGGDTPEWAVLVNKTIANLQDVMVNVTTLIHSFSDLLKDDRETVGKALAAVDNLNAIYESGRRTYEKLDAILMEMNTSFKTMTDSQATSIQLLDSIATAINASSDAVVQLTRPFATVGVARLAQDTFNSLQQAQNQQQYINEVLTKHLATISKIQSAPQQTPVYSWWDIRRFFATSRRRQP
jgi:hypothetical protein